MATEYNAASSNSTVNATMATIELLNVALLASLFAEILKNQICNQVLWRTHKELFPQDL